MCRLSLVAGSGGHSLVAGHRLLTAVAAPCGGAWALGCSGFGSWGAWALLLHGIWDLPGPGIEPVSPALQGRFSTMATREAPGHSLLILQHSLLGLGLPLSSQYLAPSLRSSAPVSQNSSPRTQPSQKFLCCISYISSAFGGIWNFSFPALLKAHRY